MKLKVGYEKIKGFSSPVKKAEEVNEWGWWAFCNGSDYGSYVYIKNIGEDINEKTTSL